MVYKVCYWDAEAGVQKERDATVAEVAEIAALKNPPLPSVISALRRDVDVLAKRKRDAIVADISPAEMASWPIKRSEALAYQASGLPTDAPTLGVEATARGITLADLVTKVLTKAQMLSLMEAGISGYSGKLGDQLAACTTLAEVSAIDINAGWPV